MLRRLGACWAVASAAVPAFAYAAVDSDEPRIGARRQPADARWELGASFTGRSYSIRYQIPGDPELSGLAERLRVDLIDFRVPVRDDGTPYALQTFLQRTSSIDVHVDTGHFETNDPFGSPLRTDWDAELGGGVNLYALPWLNLFADASYGYNSLTDQVGLATVGSTTHSFFGDAGLGFRLGDVLLRGSYYAVSQHNSRTSLPFRQGVALSAFAALARRVTISVAGATVRQGGHGELSVEYFASRKVGIFASWAAGKGQFYQTGPAVTRNGGSAGVGGWMYGSMELVARYSLTYESRSPSTPVTVAGPTDAGYRQITHALLFQTSFRFH